MSKEAEKWTFYLIVGMILCIYAGSIDFNSKPMIWVYKNIDLVIAVLLGIVAVTCAGGFYAMYQNSRQYDIYRQHRKPDPVLRMVLNKPRQSKNLAAGVQTAHG